MSGIQQAGAQPPVSPRTELSNILNEIGRIGMSEAHEERLSELRVRFGEILNSRNHGLDDETLTNYRSLNRGFQANEASRRRLLTAQRDMLELAELRQQLAVRMAQLEQENVSLSGGPAPMDESKDQGA